VKMYATMVTLDVTGMLLQRNRKNSRVTGPL
jgi:hypothetical protein